MNIQERAVLRPCCSCPSEPDSGVGVMVCSSMPVDPVWGALGWMLWRVKLMLLSGQCCCGNQLCTGIA